MLFIYPPGCFFKIADSTGFYLCLLDANLQSGIGYFFQFWLPKTVRDGNLGKADRLKPYQVRLSI